MKITDYENACLSRFVEYLDSRGLAQNSIRSYRADILSFLSWLPPETRVIEITRKHIERFITASRQGRVPYSKGKAKPSTCNHRLTAIRKYLDWLELQDAISRNPARGIEFLRTKQPVASWLSKDQVNNLLYHTKKRSRLDYIILHMLYYSALRCGELTRLRRRDIDLDELTITIHGKGEKTRYVPMTRPEIRALRSWITDTGPIPENEPVILNLQKKPLTTKFIYDRVTRAGRRLGLHCSPHTLRHSRATHLLNAGLAMAYVREILGHESIRTTEIYSHVPKDAVRRAYDRVTKELG